MVFFLEKNNNYLAVGGIQECALCMQLPNKCVNNIAVNTLWNATYYTCTNIIQSIKIVCVGGGGGVQNLYATYYYVYNVYVV